MRNQNKTDAKQKGLPHMCMGGQGKTEQTIGKCPPVVKIST